MWTCKAQTLSVVDTFSGLTHQLTKTKSIKIALF